MTRNMIEIQSWANSLDRRIRPVKPSKGRLEDRGYCIIEFSAGFLDINKDLGSTITRSVVEYFWNSAVCNVYPTPEPHRTYLLYQVYCAHCSLAASLDLSMIDARKVQSPMFEDYWQKKNNVDGYRAKRERQRTADAGFWPFPRRLSRKERDRDRGTLIIGSSDWEYIVPELNLTPLDHVKFLALAKRIMKANPQRSLKLEMMKAFWRMLMKEVYDFVQESERTSKLLEVSLL